MEVKGFFDNRVARFFLLLGIIVLVFALTDFIGFSKGGFESAEILNLRNFYIGGFIAAIALISFFIYSIALKSGDEKYGRSIGFASLGEKPHLRVLGRFTYIQFSWLFLIILLLFGLLNFNGIFGQQKTYTGVGVLEQQQFTKTDSLLYSFLLIPIAENLPAAALFAFIILMLGILARKYKWNFAVYVTIFMIALFIIGGLFGLGNHKLRYSTSDIALQKVFVFWGVGGVVTGATGFFIPFLQIHQINNLFFDLARLYSSDAINLGVGVMILLLSVGYIWHYKGRWFGTSQNKVEQLEV